MLQLQDKYWRYNTKIYQKKMQNIKLSLFLSFSYMQFRLQEKVSDLESENQVLRTQALAISPSGKTLSARSKTTIIQVTVLNF